MENKRGQVWVETVIYTLIGLVLIGTVLAFATPAIEKQKDKATIERTAQALGELDNSILNVKRAGISNTRKIDFYIGEGRLILDGNEEKIIFEIDESAYEYSQSRLTVDIPSTNMKAKTEKIGNKLKVTLNIE